MYGVKAPSHAKSTRIQANKEKKTFSENIGRCVG